MYFAVDYRGRRGKFSQELSRVVASSPGPTYANYIWLEDTLTASAAVIEAGTDNEDENGMNDGVTKQSCREQAQQRSTYIVV